MKHIIYIILVLLATSSCKTKSGSKANGLIGGPCDGCEAIFEYGDANLNAVDTIPQFRITPNKLKLTGTVFNLDGKTPAANVILYIYQTNQEGIYEKKGNEKGWGTRHGYFRGWVKTDEEGHYTFYTFRPGAYPNTDEPAHIHFTVKEPSKNEYYIDSIFFDDDPKLTNSKRENLENRGGSGIGKPILKDGMLTVKRDIILGLNIPNYF